MPKVYHPNADELQGATPLNERLWVPRYRAAIISVLNTHEGRDFFGIDADYWPYSVTHFYKQGFSLDISKDAGPGAMLSEVYIGAKFTNRIRANWREFVKLLDRNTLLDILSSWHPIYDRNGKELLMVAGAITTTVFPDSNVESDTVDGDVSQLGPDTWDALHDGEGNQARDEISTCVSSYNTTGTTDQYEQYRRSIYLFATGEVIPASHTIDSATFEFTCTQTQQDLATDSLSMVTSNPVGSTALAAGDFNSFGTAIQAANLTLSGIDAGGTNYNPFTMDSTGLGNIAQGGTTISKFGTILLSDLTDSEPTFSASKANNANIKSADIGGTSYDPKLVIIHVSTFTPQAIMF